MYARIVPPRLVPPTIDGPLNIKASYTEEIDDEWILSHYTFEDNVTPSDKIKKWIDGTYYSKKMGSYSLLIMAKDEDNRQTSYPLTLEIIDSIPPKIYGPDTLSFTIYSAPTLEEILSYYVVIDEMDGLCEKVITKDTYSPSSKKEGTYVVALQGTDSSNNITTKEISVQIKTPVDKVWKIQNVTLVTTPSHYLNSQEIISELINQRIIEDIPYLEVFYLKNTYASSYDIAGSYSLKIELTPQKQLDSKIEIDLTILVQNKKDPPKQEPSLKQKIYDFFQTIINRIQSWFKS